jgi:hypothetical protein
MPVKGKMVPESMVAMAVLLLRVLDIPVVKAAEEVLLQPEAVAAVVVALVDTLVLVALVEKA